MFDDSGIKIKNVASALCWIGIILSIIIGLALIVSGNNLNNSYYTRGSGTVYIWTGIGIAVIGSLMSWISSLLIYGFGELIWSQQRTEETAQEILNKMNVIPEPAKNGPSTSWKCLNCGQSNSEKFNFCTGCDTEKPQNWKCLICGSSNIGEHAFCSNCGKARGTEPPSLQCVENGEEGDMIATLNSMKSASEICTYLESKHPEEASADTRDFLERVKKLASMEARYGNAKKDAMVLATGFFSNGCKIFPVDRTAEQIICPVCGFKMRGNRAFCTNCHALFR